MALLCLHDIHLSFGGRPLLDGVGFNIEAKDRICLAGRNGAGKSTLLGLLAGTIQPDSGQVSRQAGLHLEVLLQEVPQGLSGRVLDLMHLPGEGADREALAEARYRQYAQKLEFDVESLFERLSGGVRRKVLLASALARDPQLLILDEPTNHLDIPSIQWLEAELGRRNAAVIFVSHDQRFAANMAKSVLELDRGQLHVHRLGWEAFLDTREARLEAEDRARVQEDKLRSNEEAWLRRGVKARRTRDEGRVKALLQMREDFRQRRNLAGQVRLELQESSASGDLVMECQDLGFGWPGSDKPLVKDFSFRIDRGMRIGIVGPNGAGKTTLVRLLTGSLAPDTGKIRLGSKLQLLYFDQLRSQLREDKSLAWNVAGGDDTVVVGGKQRHINAWLGDFLFEPESLRSPVSTLSGGERNRLLLAKLFTKESNLLVMDEPSNDLDADTLELLEERLSSYGGTLLVVSHDRYFLDNVVTQLLILEGDGRVREFVGGWSEWEQWSKNQSAAARESTRDGARDTKAGHTLEEKDGGGTQDSRVRQRSKTKGLGFREQQEMDGLPARIAAEEDRLALVHRRMEDPAFYRQDAGDLARAREEEAALSALIASLWERWAELEERQGF